MDFSRIDYLKGLLDRKRPLDRLEVKRLHEYDHIEMVYNSNAIEGNTLTRFETKMVIEQGLTVGEKGLKYYLEAVNLSEAIEYAEELATQQHLLTEKDLKQLHHMILKGTNEKHAGVYRHINVFISGSEHKPPAPFHIQPDMEQLFKWYEENSDQLHPVELAAIFHFKLVSIHPFVDGNGRTSRLCMNFILTQNGYPPVIVKADDESKREYYRTLEHGNTKNDVQPFVTFIKNNTENALVNYLDRLGIPYDQKF